MIKTILPILLLSGAIAMGVIQPVTKKVNIKMFAMENGKENKHANDDQEETEEIQAYLNYRHLKYMDPATGEINYQAITDSRNALEDYRNSNQKNTRSFPTLKWVKRGPNDVGGRVRSLLIDKNNANKLFLASAGGGLYLSTNAGDTWVEHPQSDTLSSLQGSSVAQSINGDIYYATGEGYNTSGSPIAAGGTALPGDGIFKSVDGGVTFTHLTATKPGVNAGSGDWAHIIKVACSPLDNNLVFAGTNNGLKKSINGGTTWASLTTSANGIPTNAVITDLAFAPNGNMIVGTTSNIYVSVNGGQNFQAKWANANSSGLPNLSISRTNVAIAKSNPNHIYVLAINTSGGGGLRGIYESTNFGSTWSLLLAGGGQIEPFGTKPPNPIFQGFWDVCFDVNPADEYELYVGGMQDLYRYKPSYGWQGIGNWLGSANNAQNIHSDMHGLTYDQNNPNILYICTDGGVYKTFNASDFSPVLVEKNDGLNNLQALTFDASSTDKIISGSQDNGTNIQGYNKNYPIGSRRILGGDGGNCYISDVFPNVIFGSVSYSAELLRSSADNPEYPQWNNTYDKTIDSDNDDSPDEGALWGMPTSFKEWILPDTSSAMLIGTANRLAFAQQINQTAKPEWIVLAGPAGFNNAYFTAVHITDDGTTVFAATNAGAIYRVKGLDLKNKTYTYTGTTWNNAGVTLEYTGINAGAFVTCLSTDEVDGETLIITTSSYGSNIANYVRKVANAKTGAVPLTATSIVNNLPPMPINSSAFVPGLGKNYIVLGTESGIWGTDNGGASWQELNNMDANYNNWHPRVPVARVVFKNVVGYNGPVLFTGTHGRGMFTTYSLASQWPTLMENLKNNTPNVNVYPNPASSYIQINWDVKNIGDTYINLYSYTGNKVYTTTVANSKGNNNVQIPTKHLAAGAYLVNIIHNGQQVSKQVIISN
jgi:hypothetical protein